MIGLIAFGVIWYLGIIEINGATFNIVDANVTTYWDYDDEDREPFPIVPMRSRQCYEDGLVGLKPDFNTMLNSYISGETILGLEAHFNDGYSVLSDGSDFHICIYPENFKIEKTSLKPFHNLYKITDHNSFDIEYNRPNYAKNSYYQSHSLSLDLEVEVNGLCSEKYLNYKLKEIYLYYTLDALREHVGAEEEFLKKGYLDTLNNLMFVKDNYKIAKEEFLNLDPNTIEDINWLYSKDAVELYSKDEELLNVVIATSK